uniref:Uncharacterized protein n=1 Tax=Arundo donax TaxID=35708 RepID=A0A0A8ZFN0_ARUDO
MLLPALRPWRTALHREGLEAPY